MPLPSDSRHYYIPDNMEPYAFAEQDLPLSYQWQKSHAFNPQYLKCFAISNTEGLFFLLLAWLYKSIPSALQTTTI